MKSVAAMFNIRPGEEKSTSLMIGHAFSMGLSTTFFETATAALFLTRFQAGTIPLVYIGAAVVSTLTGLAYSRLRDRISFWSLMKATLLFLIVTVFGFRAGLEVSTAAWLIFGSFLWYRVVSILTDLEYWAVAARLYDVRQSKRLFGFIGSGEVIARTLGSFSVPLLVVAIAVRNLIVISGLALLVSLALVLALARLTPMESSAGREKTADDAERGGSLRQIRRLLAHPYVAMIFALTALGILGKYFVDFAFLQQMQTRYKDLANLAGFFGVFSGVTQVLNLALRVFVSGRVLSRWGVKVGLLILPLSHVVCTLLIVFAGVRGNASMAIVFWLVVANQGIYKTMKHPFDNPSIKVLYQPLSREERLTVQIMNEVVFSPITIGIAGGVMLLFTMAVKYDPITFAYVMLATFAGWLVLGVRAFRGYAAELVSALKARIVDSVTFTLDDEPSIAVVRSKLESANPADVIFCLSLLEKIEHKSLAGSLVRLVGHPSPEVRRYALLAIGRLKVVAGLGAVERCAEDKNELIAVRCAAIRSLALVGDEGRVRKVVEYLNHRDEELRHGAMIGLLRRGDPRYTAVVRHRINTCLHSVEPADRVFAARVIGEAALADSALTLLRLLKDPDIEVRQAALEACGGISDPDVLEVTVEALAEPRLAGPALLALSSAGEAAIPLLETAYERHRSVSARRRLIRTIGRIGGSSAVEFLRAKIDSAEATLRTQVLESLSMCRYSAPAVDVPAIEERIRAEVAEAAWKLAVLKDLSSSPDLDLLRSSLEDEIASCRKRLFLLVSFLGDAKVLLSARDNYFSDARERRAYAIEVLDLMLPDRLRPIVLPLLDDLPPDARLGRLSKVFPQTSSSEAERIREILAGEEERTSPWARSVAVRAVVARPIPELVPIVDAARAQESTDRVLSDTAAEAVLGEIPHGGGHGTMYSTIERVIILKGVPMFAGASEQILAEIASVLDEVHFAAGEVVFNKGDFGSSMYIVISGCARVHDGERTIVHLGDRDVFGEMAILDPEPRSADITAVEPTSVFRLDRDAFLELMADHVEIVTGVLHVICQRLRAATSGHRTDDRPPAPKPLTEAALVTA